MAEHCCVLPAALRGNGMDVSTRRCGSDACAARSRIYCRTCLSTRWAAKEIIHIVRVCACRLSAAVIMARHLGYSKRHLVCANHAANSRGCGVLFAAVPPILSAAIGDAPRKSGKPNVVEPSPTPNVVP